MEFEDTFWEGSSLNGRYDWVDTLYHFNFRIHHLVRALLWQADVCICRMLLDFGFSFTGKIRLRWVRVCITFMARPGNFHHFYDELRDDRYHKLAFLRFQLTFVQSRLVPYMGSIHHHSINAITVPYLLLTLLLFLSNSNRLLHRCLPQWTATEGAPPRLNCLDCCNFPQVYVPAQISV
jgi:hypothetical protein